MEAEQGHKKGLTLLGLTKLSRKIKFFQIFFYPVPRHFTHVEAKWSVEHPDSEHFALENCFIPVGEVRLRSWALQYQEDQEWEHVHSWDKWINFQSYFP